MRFETLMVVNIVTVFWNVTPCGLDRNQHSREIFCFVDGAFRYNRVKNHHLGALLFFVYFVNLYTFQAPETCNGVLIRP